MFTKIQALMYGMASMVIVDNPDRTLTVTLCPKRSSKDGGTLDTPLTFTATAEELDAGIAEALASYTNKRQSLSDQLAATEAILEAAKKDATDKAKKSIAKPSKGSSTPAPESSDDDDDNHDDKSGVAGNASNSSDTTTTTPPAASPEASLWG